jgi:hypothetical protein
VGSTGYAGARRGLHLGRGMRRPPRPRLPAHVRCTGGRGATTGRATHDVHRGHASRPHPFREARSTQHSGTPGRARTG